MPTDLFQRSSVRDVVIVGDFLAVATSNPGVEVIDLHHMKRRGRLEGHLLAVSAVAAIEGEGLLVTGSHDTFLRQVFYLCPERNVQTYKENVFSSSAHTQAAVWL